MSEKMTRAERYIVAEARDFPQPPPDRAAYADMRALFDKLIERGLLEPEAPRPGRRRRYLASAAGRAALEDSK